jgi:hypothetical protein
LLRVGTAFACRQELPCLVRHVLMMSFCGIFLPQQLCVDELVALGQCWVIVCPR